MSGQSPDNSEKLSFLDRGFFPSWIAKFLYTLISVKVWGLLVSAGLSTYLLLLGLIDNKDWVAYNTTIWALIFGMKEIFRIQEKRETMLSKTRQRELSVKSQAIEIAGKDMGGQEDLRRQPSIRMDGKEIVGIEPDRA